MTYLPLPVALDRKAHPAMASLVSKRAFLIALAITLCAGLVFGGHQIVLVLERIATLQAAAADAMLTHPAIIFLVVCYVILLAIPFVPGAELGFVLLLVFGADIAPVVYLATVAGMMMAFAVGRFVPREKTERVLLALGLEQLVSRIAEARGEAERPYNRPSESGTWFTRFLRHRYAALAVVINTPGNTILGGGGGLAFAAGVSRLFPPVGFLGTVLVAVSPVPLAFLFLMPG